MMTKGGESPLPKRALGATSLMVHPLCFGTAELGDLANVFPYAVGEEQAVATARAILDGPIKASHATPFKAVSRQLSAISMSRLPAKRLPVDHKDSPHYPRALAVGAVTPG